MNLKIEISVLHVNSIMFKYKTHVDFRYYYALLENAMRPVNDFVTIKLLCEDNVGQGLKRVTFVLNVDLREMLMHFKHKLISH